jgi:hypothetical protein
MKIKQEQVPMVQPLQATTGQTSHSRSKNKGRAHLHQVEESLPEPDNTGKSSGSWSRVRKQAMLRQVVEPPLQPDDAGYLEMHQVIEEEGDRLPEPDLEEMQPQALVWSCIYLSLPHS